MRSSARNGSKENGGQSSTRAQLNFYGCAYRTKYAYDPDGNLTDTKDPAGNIVHLEYDELGRKTLTRDPDLGTWTYGYNGFGDLIEQTDAKNQTTLLATKMTYDRLGRMRTKTDPAGNTAEWVYDLGQAGIGKLSASISPPNDKLAGECALPDSENPTSNRAVRQLGYNEFGDLSDVSECVRGEAFLTSYEYDRYGRQNRVTYPTVNGKRFSVESVFSSTGYLHYLADGNDPNLSPYWVAKEMNPAGQVTKEQTRNGVEVVSNRNDATGWLLGSKAIAKPWGGEVIQDLGFTFDEVGSLRTRTRGPSAVFPALNETFTYDKLDRLHTAEISIPSASGFGETQTFDYDNLGNISKKDGKTYAYTGCNAGPHAVCTVGGGTAYTYDANGNMTKGNGRSVEYDSANKPLHIESDISTGAKIDFAYGADGHRVLQEVAAKTGGDTSRTIYVGLGATGKSIYERTTTGSKVEHVQFLYAGGAHGGNAIALRVTSGATESMKYNLFDHLGSVTAMTDDVGRVIGPAADPANSTVFWYDAWGSRRNPDGSRTSTSANLQPGHREYTGHETIPQVGLVNMNGRVYDPDLGRFLSPDPNVQFTANLQSYNRYSYVLNNPLRYTDPTGYFLETLLSEGPFALMNGPGLLTTLGTLLACSAGGPGACLGVMAWSAAITATTMAMQGASFGQVAMAMAIQYGASAIGGGIAGEMIGDAGGGFGMSVLGGAISGGVAAAIATPLLTGSVRGLGESVLMGAVNGAAMAGVTWAVRNGNAVSVASKRQQGGGGSGAQRLEALLKTRMAEAGASWDWADSSADLFNADQTGFSDQFIKRMQPVADKLKLNVDLAKVRFEFGGPTNYTVGYRIRLQGGALQNLSFDDVLGATLHELGHVVQFQNGAGIMTRLAGEIRQMEEIRQGRLIPDDEVLPRNLDKGPLYEQDPYLRQMSLQQLANTHLLGPWTLDSQADRFRDLLLAR